MKTCSHCQTANADDYRFCQHCGRPLEAPAGPSDKTVRWTGQPVTPVTPVMPQRPFRGTVEVADLFAGKGRLVIGRAPDCDVCLPHPTVSRYHALLERLPHGLRLRDLASVNGTSVAGRRITEPVLLHEGERVGVGPFLFTLKDGVIHALDSSRSLRLEARGLEKVIALGNGQTRKLLDDINLVVHPGEFVSLLGPSGSGKSTLMDCLNGRRRATGGRVLANGEDFYRHFDNFRQSLGYVPQKDIVHTGLTVYQALYYTARLRLPTDTDPAELHARIEEVLRQMELGPHRDTLVANLSGGQIKRVSLGAELLAQPCLLYIDEATSGLDAGTEARMMRLFRRLADEGRSIVCITHNVDNVDQCHLALVLARGKLVYYGPPAEAPRYFAVRRVSEIYDRLTEKELAEWESRFTGSTLYREYVRDRLEPATPPEAGLSGPGEEERPESLRLSALLADGRKLVSPSKWPPLADRIRDFTARHLRLRALLSPAEDAWHQFRVLTARYVRLILGDRRGLRLLLLQAPVVALFLLVGFVHKPFQERVSAVDVFVGRDGELTPEARELVHGFRSEVNLGGRTFQLDGAEALDLYRQLRARGLPSVPGLAHAPVKVTFRGEPMELSAAEWEKFRAAFERENPRYTYMLLFVLVMIVLWFGCNNAAKEIVKEEAVYGRERAVNLGIVPYLASKFVVQSAITALHALLLMVILYGTLELLARFVPGHSAPSPAFRLGYAAQFGVLVLLSMTGVALGLLLSACVATPDRANALLPYVLIPQMILGGGFLGVSGGLLGLLAMTLSPVYWAYRAVHLGASQLPASFPGRVDYPDGVALPVAALLIQMALLLLLTAWALRRKETFAG
jgi:ABC-type multidrug transport system ATPase subunit